MKNIIILGIPETVIDTNGKSEEEISEERKKKDEEKVKTIMKKIGGKR